MLRKIIKETIIQKGGAIGFDEFMNLALYHHQYGYYRSDLVKFHKAGDFTTAPEISPLFGRLIAKQLAELEEVLDTGAILEFGAGSGVLAGEVVETLAKIGKLPKYYYILELSANLQQRQYLYLKKKLPHLITHFVWLKKLPENFSGVIMANEVLDAMPSKRFALNFGNLSELCVVSDDMHFKYQKKLPKDSQAEQIRSLLAQDKSFAALKNIAYYESEFNFYLKPWLNTLYEKIRSGIILIIDYGYTQKEYYHPERTRGTLRCYYRHRVHDNPFIHIGKQDISTSVHFSYLAHVALELGFELVGFTTQAAFLLNLGIEKLLYKAQKEEAHLALAQGAKQLLLPNFMGEIFKVIAFSKNKSIKLSSFKEFDKSHYLF